MTMQQLHLFLKNKQCLEHLLDERSTGNPNLTLWD